MSRIINDAALDQTFRQARTHRSWTGEPVSDVVLQAAYDLARMAPTSANCSPMRVLFVRSPESKARLKPALSKGNVEQTMKAPVTAIIGYDLQFHELLPRLHPIADARGWFAGDDDLIRATAFRNGSLQGAYFIIAARAVGLDCGPMSGFDNAKVDAAFFPDGRVKSNFLCNLGYGDGGGMRPRAPRLEFDEACKII
ncbi:MAG: malonic semialdehyde reductase [Dongiaceae bacterium]